MATHVFESAPEPPSELGRYRILSSRAGVRVSPLCLGALSIGDAWQGVRYQPFIHHRYSDTGSRDTNEINDGQMLGSMSKEASFKLLDAYYDAGGNFIDTAVGLSPPAIHLCLSQYYRIITRMSNQRSGSENGWLRGRIETCLLWPPSKPRVSASQRICVYGD